MRERSKPKIAILSIRNTYSYGGVLATLKIVHDFCSEYFDPTVFFLGFDKEISASVKGFSRTSCNRPLDYCSMKSVEIGARWAFWEPGHYAFTKDQWEQALKDYDYFFVVSATPIAGHPLVLLNKKFAIWISTPYDGDRTERVKRLAGIRSVINRLAEPRMRAIEKSVLQNASFVWPLSSYSKEQFEKTLGKKLARFALCGHPIDTPLETRLMFLIRGRKANKKNMLKLEIKYKIK